MQNKPIIVLMLCTIFTIIGLFGGYMAAVQSPQVNTPHATGVEKEKDDHSGHDHGTEDDHSGHDHGSEQRQEESPTLSMQAVKNLKVKTKEIESSHYITYRSITARIEATPKTTQPIIAPFAGVIKSINIDHGEMIKKGSVIATFMRDSIPRPELKLTGGLLDPEQKLKGLSAQEISKGNGKTNVEKQIYFWKSTLIKHGYWNKKAQNILNNLSDDLKNLPFTTAVIGELSANGYLSNKFVKWIIENPYSQKYFFEVSSLILEGKSIRYVQDLVDNGVLESLVTIRAPQMSDDYDVHEIHKKVGDKIEMGEAIGLLHDMRELHVEAHARGSEIQVLLKALENDENISAVPLAKGAGQKLENLKIQNIQDDTEKGGAKVHLEIKENTPIIKKGEGDKEYRSWKIRIGTRYIIRVPLDIFKDVFVIPSNAIVEEGADRIVFIEDGDTYKSAKVVVLFQNDEVAVLSKDSEIFAGDPIVIEGAFGLGLALKAQTGGAVDAHAGHNH